MNNTLWVLVLLSLAACGRNDVQPQACPLEQGCRVVVGDESVTVRSDRAPTPARPFMLQVEATGAKEVRAQFEMRGMSMTTPSYRLQRLGTHFNANVILPVCVSGRSDWILKLNVDDKLIELGFSATS